MIVDLKNDQRIQQHVSFVGFTAWKQTTQYVRFGDVVRFDGIILNEGGYYDTQSNSFECPFDGVYFTCVTLHGDEHDTGLANGRVIKNTTDMFGIIHDNYRNPDTSSSNSGLFRCNAGELVRVIAENAGRIHGEETTHYTSFTVFMVKEEGGIKT